MDFIRGLFAGAPPVSTSLRPEVDRLLEELVKIGKSDDFLSEHMGGPFNSQYRHNRARQIGKRLHDIGGLALMQYAQQYVRRKTNKQLAEHLEYAWADVGDWKA
jgi:hypothetical protein